MSPVARCLVADDHPALVAAVSAFLGEHGFDVVAIAADGTAALAAAARHQPDVVLADYRMPYVDGADLVRALRRAAPMARIAVYTAEADDALVAQALGAGAAGIVLKEAPLADLVRALTTIYAGGSYLDPALGFGGPARGRGCDLTEREARVLALVADGLTYDEIGRRLSIGSETVRTHVQKACDRLGAATRTQAVATAIRLGVIG